MRDYKMLEKIGEGTYGQVYKAINREGRVVAIKKTRLDLEQGGVPSTTLREVSVLQSLNESIHIVRLLDVEHTREQERSVLFMVPSVVQAFEYLPMDLKKFLEDQWKHELLPLELVKVLMYQLLKGVAYLHGRGMMHRDLKPSNLLINDSNPDVPCLKIADLGLARVFHIPIRPYTHEIMTLWYWAPEVLLGTTHYALPIDMWSVGCIFSELLTGQPLFESDCEIQQLMCIFQVLGTPTEEVWKGVTKLQDWHTFPQWKPRDLARAYPDLGSDSVDLLRGMLQYQPARRISAKEALKHPFFAELDKEGIDEYLAVQCASNNPSSAGQGQGE
ncbi:cyclin dependent kinase [Coccomyxa subellipsoidea C-169]|uniref:cyclin-dependent kinase n=1 Tax=Coccomyxa subellipsoidea (strain C-169) TaxID=574566 RepID=I0YMD6_COCSC|nr:cyclin dependent kinase [Coccomyxa subellipsoidea C-169]EIE19555.1 cyclin dependent kinase [Coccomyxa subellipsoidea C-169]|eukprot:XP_005644099.1 cyclin dependent kinase [Coccomyxa subellipsoidea C-169]